MPYELDNFLHEINLFNLTVVVSSKDILPITLPYMNE
jgi:hypothetical protein